MEPRGQGPFGTGDRGGTTERGPRHLGLKQMGQYLIEPCPTMDSSMTDRGNVVTVRGDGDFSVINLDLGGGPISSNRLVMSTS